MDCKYEGGTSLPLVKPDGTELKSIEFNIEKTGIPGSFNCTMTPTYNKP